MLQQLNPPLLIIVGSGQINVQVEFYSELKRTFQKQFVFYSKYTVARICLSKLVVTHLHNMEIGYGLCGWNLTIP